MASEKTVIPKTSQLKRATSIKARVSRTTTPGGSRQTKRKPTSMCSWHWTFTKFVSHVQLYHSSTTTAGVFWFNFPPVFPHAYPDKCPQDSISSTGFPPCTRCPSGVVARGGSTFCTDAGVFDVDLVSNAGISCEGGQSHATPMPF